MGESSVCIRSQTPQNEPDMTGWLFKWTNYLKGYQRRWFVLQNGLLSYYRAEYTGGITTLSIRRRRRFRNNGNQAEMAHTCRGSISLHGALIHTVDACSFVISNGGTQTFHIRAGSEVERQCWVTALELSKAKAIRNMESEEDEEEADAGSGSPEEWSSVVRELQGRLDDLRTCSDLIAKHGAALQRALGELETSPECEAAQNKSKTVSERATLFRIASNAMMNACSEYLCMAQAQGCKWTRLLQHERDQRQRLQEMVETLAQQHSKLEQAAAANAQRPNVAVSASEEDEEETEFYDALAESAHGSNTTLGNVATSQTSHCSETTSASTGETVSGGPSGGSGGINSGGGGGGSGSTGGGDTFTLNIPTGSGRRRSSDSSSETDDNLDNNTHQVVVVTGHRHSNMSSWADGSGIAGSVVNKSGTGSRGRSDESTNFGGKADSVKGRRTSVPAKPHYPLNLWSIMKNCIGKDLSKIPMPVNFSEPLSMLQRLAEDFEYADILDVAAKCNDPCEQLAYVAAFTISSYSTTSCRTGKPFNPLLGETYEMDRTDDFGWRLISEQVSHHPPMVAQFCEGNGWKCWQEFTMTSKFRGKYLQVIPLGTAHVQFENGNRYSWRKVTTTVHNIIVGKLWVDQHGDMEIIGREGPAAGIKCHLKYIPYSYFSKESQRRVKGAVMDTFGIVQWIINGKWDRSVEIAQVHSAQGSMNNPIYETGPSVLAWKCNVMAGDSDKYYNFTLLACQLNEREVGVAPTDSRNRPDQRLMEEQEWDCANKEKVRLEEKQRAARREREAEAEKAAREGRPYPPYEPIWFKQIKDPETDNIIHVFKGDYWEHKKNGDFSTCPNIF